MKKNKKEILKEELKKFNRLLEYSFYAEHPKEIDEEDDNTFDTGDIEEPTEEVPAETQPEEAIPQEPLPQEPVEDEVDIDITDLVNTNNEIKQSVDKATQVSNQLLNKFSELEMRVANMSSLSHKIDNLEQEITKRLPTPTEKLNIRTMDSYPFNIKLSDYWKDELEDDKKEHENKEYTLTKQDINTSYNDMDIKKSLDYTEENV